jgi:hypothetical protein
MASHWPFGHLQPKLWAKEGPGVKLAVWLPTTKSRESTSSRCPNWECDTSLERSRRGLQVWLDLVAIRLRNRELWAPKVPGLHPGRFRDDFGIISGFHFGSPGNLCHLDVAPTGRRRVYYMGDGGGIPRVRAVVSLVVRSARGLS